MNAQRQHRPLSARPDRDAGFSLLELVIVIGLMGVVTTIGMGAFTDLTGAWHDTQALSEMRAAAGDALEIIREDIERVPSSTLTGAKIIGRNDTRTGIDRVYHQLAMANDQVVLPVRGVPGVSKVQYVLDHSDGHALVRIVHAAENSSEPARARVVERFDVVRMRIEYQERANSEWFGAWDREDYPANIRVSLTLVNRADPTEQVARKATFRVRVR